MTCRAPTALSVTASVHVRMAGPATLSPASVAVRLASRVTSVRMAVPLVRKIQTTKKLWLSPGSPLGEYDTK